MMNLAVTLMLLALFTYLTGIVAGSRGRTIKTWYRMGAIFGPFALLATVLLPRQNLKR